MKQTLIWFNLQREGTRNGLSNIKDTFAESFQLQMSVLHQSMCIFKAGLSSSYDGWAKYKEKVADVSDPKQNVEATCSSKLKFTLLKYLFIKRVQKNYSKLNYMYVANTAILTTRIFSRRYHFRLWVFASTGEYFYY